jgi:hypothetical protein
MNYDKIELKNLAYHFDGQLKKGYPRQYVNHELMKELASEKVMLNQMWKIKLELPLDVSADCDRAMPWVQGKIHDFVEAGFFHLGTHAAVKEVTRDERKADEPFWFIDVIHPEYKDPRETVKKTIAYEQPIL